MWICQDPNCKAQNEDSDKRCYRCGLGRAIYPDNYCINPNCKMYKVVLKDPEQKFCHECDSMTLFWKEVQDMI